jgi:hypothetical protein
MKILKSFWGLVVGLVTFIVSLITGKGGND